MDFLPKEWDDAVTEFNGTVYHSSWFLEYMMVSHQNKEIQNLSFALIYDSKFVAIIPLFIEKINNQWQMSMGEEPIASMLYDITLPQKEILDIFEDIIGHINNLAEEKSCTLSRFHISPLMSIQQSNHINFYKLFDYKEVILEPNWYIFKCDFSYVINMDVPMDQLYTQIRRRYKSYINKTLKKSRLIILDNNTVTKELFDKYVEFYYSIKGQRRSIEAFTKDYEAIKNGIEILFICEYNEKFIGSIAIHQYNNMARYNSALMLKVEDLYPNHLLVWESIKYLKDKHCKYYEIGEQVIDNGMYNLSKKEKDLSFFKSGWGGDLYPWMKAQKEYKLNDIR